MRKPVIPENQNDSNDIRNVYNPDKGPRPSNFYAQQSSTSLNKINPVHPTGLEPPPPDMYYDVPW